MNDIIVTLLIIICICTMIGTIIDAFESIRNYKELKRSLQTSEDKLIENLHNSDLRDIDLLMRQNSISNIDNVLDQCIRDAGDIYNILVLAPAQLSENGTQYINEKEQKRMTEYVVQSVYTRMSDSMRKLLSLSYKIDNDQDLDKIIRLRVNLYMIDFITKYNELK